MTKKTWLEMSNGQRLTAITFVAWIYAGDGELRFEFEASNPPIYAGDSNLYSRLSFEMIKAHFATLGYHVDYIIRGECDEVGARSCYVHDGKSRVPFAVIRPKVFS